MLGGYLKLSFVGWFQSATGSKFLGEKHLSGWMNNILNLGAHYVV